MRQSRGFELFGAVYVRSEFLNAGHPNSDNARREFEEKTAHALRGTSPCVLPRVFTQCVVLGLRQMN